MKVGPLSTDALFDLTGKIGHVDDIDQLKHIVRYTEARIKEVRRQRRAKASK